MEWVKKSSGSGEDEVASSDCNVNDEKKKENKKNSRRTEYVI